MGIWLLLMVIVIVLRELERPDPPHPFSLFWAGWNGLDGAGHWHRRGQHWAHFGPNTPALTAFKLELAQARKI